MANVSLYVDDPAQRITLRGMLMAVGHRVVDAAADVVIADTSDKAIELARSYPTLVLATASDIEEAVAAMEQGVYGYIFMPFRAGETLIMVRRALDTEYAAPATPEPGQEDFLSLAEAETRHILDTLQRCRNNQSKTARVLGIGRNTLWRKLKKVEKSPSLNE